MNEDLERSKVYEEEGGEGDWIYEGKMKDSGFRNIFLLHIL